MRGFVVSSFALLLAACGASAPAPEGPASTGDARVGRFTSPARTFHTNLFWIEGPSGVILIDTGFLPSDAVALVREAERATGKPVELAVVLHPNPDKFNGAHALVERGIRVVTSQQVVDHIPHVHEIRHRSFASRYPEEYPHDAPTLEAFGSETRQLEAAGTTLTLHVLGRGCSDAHVAVEWQGHLFVGDLVANRHHSWLELGYLDEWRQTLGQLARLGPRFVQPGRGDTGSAGLIEEEIAYLDAVEQIAREAEPTEPPSEAELAALRARVEERFEGYAHPVFLRVGMPAVVRFVHAHPR